MDMSAFKPVNLAEVYKNADAGVASAMQLQTMAMQAGEMRQQYERTDALRTLAKNSTITGPDGQPTFDMKNFVKGAYTIDPMQAIGFEKAQAEARKTALEEAKLQGEVDEKNFKNAAERLKFMNEAATAPFLKYKQLIEQGVPEQEARRQVQPMHEAALRNLVGSGIFTKEQIAKFDLRPQFDPQVAEAGMNQVLGAKEQLAQWWQKKGHELKVAEFDHRKANDEKQLEVSIRGQNITLRGQNLTDARAKEDLAQKGLDVKENEDGTYSVVDKKTRQAFPVLGPDGKPMASGKSQGTEGERMASGFASRMVNAEGILKGIKVGDQKSGLVEGAVGMLPFTGDALAQGVRSLPLVGSEERQKALQASMDWVRAKLRKESGAVIGPKEMEDEIKTYFPMIGDGPEVVKQKNDARRIATEGMITNAGKAYKAKAAKPKEDEAKPGEPKEGDKSKSKSGRDIVFRNGQWEYAS